MFFYAVVKGDATVRKDRKEIDRVGEKKQIGI